MCWLCVNLRLIFSPSHAPYNEVHFGVGNRLCGCVKLNKEEDEEKKNIKGGCRLLVKKSDRPQWSAEDCQTRDQSSTRAFALHTLHCNGMYKRIWVLSSLSSCKHDRINTPAESGTRLSTRARSECQPTAVGAMKSLHRFIFLDQIQNPTKLKPTLNCLTLEIPLQKAFPCS